MTAPDERAPDAWTCPCVGENHLPPTISPRFIVLLIDVRVALAAVPNRDTVAAHRRWAGVEQFLTEQDKACWAERYKPMFMDYPTEIVPAPRENGAA